MPKQAFLCERCFTPYTDEGAARACEERHCPADKIAVFHIDWGERGDRLSRNFNADEAWLPTTIVLNVPNRPPFDQHDPEPMRVRYVRESLVGSWKK